MKIQVDTSTRSIDIDGTRTARSPMSLDCTSADWIAIHMPALIKWMVDEMSRQDAALAQAGFTFDELGAARLPLTDRRWLAVSRQIVGGVNATLVRLQRRMLTRGYVDIMDDTVVESDPLQAASMWIAEHQRTLIKALLPEGAGEIDLMSLLPQAIRDRIIQYTPSDGSDEADRSQAERTASPEIEESLDTIVKRDSATGNYTPAQSAMLRAWESAMSQAWAKSGTTGVSYSASRGELNN